MAWEEEERQEEQKAGEDPWTLMMRNPRRRSIAQTAQAPQLSELFQFSSWQRRGRLTSAYDDE